MNSRAVEVRMSACADRKEQAIMSDPMSAEADNRSLEDPDFNPGVPRPELQSHTIYRVGSVEVIEPYTLHIMFDDHSEQTINFQSILFGELYGPLRDLALFNQVQVDPEVQTLTWPNGADFDPATLHDWPQQITELSKRFTV